MKAFVTKYALTQGILEIDATECGDGMIQNTANAYMDYFHKGEWYKTREEAVVRAKELLQKKIVFLKKQLAKFEEMTF